MIVKIVLGITIGFAICNQTIAQGCSDAGFCTIAGFKPNSSNDTLKNNKQKLSIIAGNGVGDEEVYVFTPAIQYDNQLNNQWAIQAKLTANYASGNLGSASGLGDVFLATTFTPTHKGKWKTGIILGAKVPLNNSNLKANSKPLPMQYQSSLGTVDVITGLTFTNQKWLIATALQLPLSGINGNTFLPAYWSTSDAVKYISSNDFKRKPDVLARIGYDISSPKKWKFNLGLLGIYHLGKDSYVDGNVSNKPIEINGSDGLTLNGTLAAWYKAGSKLTFGITAGTPFVVRDVRPDGLTRKFVFSPEIIFHF